MNKVIAILGAGPGLGSAVARRFGAEGYRIALVGRRIEPLEALSADLAGRGVTAETFSADLARAANVPTLIDAIRGRFGAVDAIYYSPASTESFLPATEMSVEMMRERVELLFLSLVAAVNAVAPTMRAQGSGAILAGFGGTAPLGLPYMSGPAPAQAAARNYLQSLHGELGGDGVRVGMVTISGVIRGSAYHRLMEAGDHDAPANLEIPLIDPNELANQLWLAASGGAELEAFYPPP